MSYTYSDLQTEIKARSILNKAGTEYDTRVKNLINTSLFRVAREAHWRNLRRKTTFPTVASYTTGTGAVAVTEDSAAVTVTGATLITDGVAVGRRVDLGGSSKPYVISTITGETTFTVDRIYDGDDATDQSYKIYGQEEYNVNVQAGRIAFLWHEDYGYPYTMQYVPDLDFYGAGFSLEDANTPVCWRQWGFDSVLAQPLEASVMTIASSAATDTSKTVTIYGVVSGYPDFEQIATDSSNGTTASAGSKSFTSIERVTKDATTTGRITVTSNTANATIAVLPLGDAYGLNEYLKVQIFPYPTRVFPVNVAYYKDPWRLVNDSDFHELGHDFDEAIILLSVAKLNYSQDKTSGDKFIALYADEIRNLKSKNSDGVLSWFPKLRRAGRSGGQRGAHPYLSYNQLGGQYGPRWR